MRIPILAVTCVAASLFSAAIVAQEVVPTGVHQDPAELFDAQHYLTTAGMPLQGNLASTKYAPIMVPWNQLTSTPSPNGNVADFQTVYIINNPDSTLPLMVDVAFFEANGTLAGGHSHTIMPKGHIQRRVDIGDLSGPQGMIQVKVDNDSPSREFVGATTYWATQVINPLMPAGSGTTRIALGMSSMQPLQEYQSNVSETVRFGPIPVRLLSGIDSVNGLLAFQNVCNPTTVVNNITVTVRGGLSGPVSNNYTINPNGTLSLFDTWNYAVSAFPTLTQDHDIVVEIKSTSGIPVLGENIFLDLFEGNAAAPVSSGGSAGGAGAGEGQEGVPQGTFLARARMSSMMLGYTPKSTLINPELTDSTYTGVALMQSTMGICNVDSGDAGPIAIEYFDNLGFPLGIDTITNLPQFSSAVIGPGLYQSPNFPSNVSGVFKGSVRISASNGPIIGWANRASENENFSDDPKMWGELLHRAGGVEHATGWLAGGVRNKIAPLVLNKFGDVLPSYIAFANHRSSNTDAYAMQFHDLAGFKTGSAIYAGLPWRTTCFSYLEQLITLPVSVFSQTNNHHHNALVSTRTKSVEGIQTIGGRIQFYLHFDGEVPIYPGPGDTL